MPANSRTILLAGSYYDPDPRRRGELLECLRRNVENDRLDEIRLFIEDAIAAQDLKTQPQLGSPKIHLINHGRRVKFNDLFSYANRELAGCTVIIANADIFFDQSLARLDGYDLSGKLLCLSRWDVQPDGSSIFFEHPGSQDAWIFRTPIQEFRCDFHLGMPACDNRLAWEAADAGLAVSNPGRSLKAHHLHLSQIHRYHEGQRLSGPTRNVAAEFLGDLSSAAIAFRETMGYTIARLSLGASSHNNERRPITMIPEPLLGRQFTQVVAYAVSPIKVEFLTSGKFYVLVGNDWDGYHLATSWLSKQACREALPPLETNFVPAFEVWSLAGKAGERLVLPTQVMLVADRIVPR